jgi:hypothetical protein
MSCKILIVFFAALSIIFLGADSLSVIELKPGTNEVTLKVLNSCNSDFKAIHVVVKPEDLPEGLTISPVPQSLDVSAKSQSGYGLLLLINVTDQAMPGSYEIPLLLKDNANHSWKYTFTAKLGVNKPDKYELSQNYPNPFNTTTLIKYALANDREQETKLEIFDLLGKQITTLVNKKQPAGCYQVSWDGKDDSGASVTSGVYFYKLNSGSYVSSKKLTVLK